MTMKRPHGSRAVLLALGGCVLAGAALADPKPFRRGDHDERHDRHRHEQRRDDWRAGRHVHFGDHHRVVVREYYVHEYHRHCPPGLARKGNGCQPPGHVRDWEYGRPLPRHVIYYDVPPVLVTRIGPPPEGHRYVRVAGDILLIAIGTGLVVDAIQDLTR